MEGMCAQTRLWFMLSSKKVVGNGVRTRVGLNSSVGSAWARCHSVAGSILLWGHFPVEGIFPLELTWVQTPFPQNSFG